MSLRASWWIKSVLVAFLLCACFPAAAADSKYRCTVTVRTKGGQTLVDKTLDVEPFWFWQTPEGMARNQAVPADLRNQLSGAQISVYCWEIQKPKLFGIIPIV